MSGHCIVCRRVGPMARKQNFLCEACAHPLEIRTFCASCGARTTLETKGGLQLLAELFPDQPHDVGTTIRLERCPACVVPGQALGTAQLFRIRLLYPTPRRTSSDEPSP